jgi:hypothetical protein
MPIAREPRRKSKTGARGGRFVRARERSQILNRHQGLDIKAVRMFAISDKPCVPFAKIIKHDWDFEASLKLRQFRSRMKAALKQLVRQKCVRTKKDSFALTNRGQELGKTQPITR